MAAKVKAIYGARVKLDTAGDTFSRRVILYLTLDIRRYIYIHIYIYMYMNIRICIYMVRHVKQILHLQFWQWFNKIVCCLSDFEMGGGKVMVISICCMLNYIHRIT